MRDIYERLERRIVEEDRERFRELLLSKPVTSCINAVSYRNIMPRIRPFVSDRLFRLDDFVATLLKVIFFCVCNVNSFLET